MSNVVINQQMLDECDDMLLDAVAAFVQAHGGIPETVGGVELVLMSPRKFCVLVHCEGHAPPTPGAIADA